MKAARCLISLVFAVLLGTGAPRAQAASYVLIPDADLAGRSDAIVRARAIGSRAVPSRETGVETLTRFARLELVRGTLPESFEVRVPGGELEDGSGAWYPGVPRFAAGREYLLFLRDGGAGAYVVAELALGAFDVVADAEGRRYATRAAFLSGGLSPVALPGTAPAAERVRDLDAFVRFLRGEAAAEYAANPATPLRPVRSGPDPLWVSIIDTAFMPNNPVRWNPPTATVGYVDDDNATLNQSGIAGGGLTEFANALATWTNDPTSTISYTASQSNPNITVHWDNVSQTAFGGTGVTCALGLLGLGGPSYSDATHTFKGDTYHAASSGVVYIRRWDCLNPYPSNALQNTITHELGHTLGLNHPDQGQSPHDPTGDDVAGAVMISISDLNRPVGLGADDREAVCWLYGLCQLSGDVNGDGTRNVADVFYLINYLFAAGPAPLFKADVDGSAPVNVADVFYLINFLFAGGPAPH